MPNALVNIFELSIQINIFKDKVNFCDIFGNMCFESTMENSTVEEICDCPLECNSISYSFSLVSTPFDPNKMCPSGKNTEDFLMNEFYVNQLSLL